MQKYSSSGSAYGGASNMNDNVSAYSYSKSTKANQQEIVIDIHVKHLKLRVQDKTALRVVWSRGKKQAKTQVKILNQQLDKAIFDEKFQINTILEIDPETGMPMKEKISKMTVTLDKSQGGTDVAEIDFNMADFKFGDYKLVRLPLKKSQGSIIDFDENETFLDIALKGTRAHGLVSKRHSAAAKSSMGGLNRSNTSITNSQSHSSLPTVIDSDLRLNGNMSELLTSLTQELENKKKELRHCKKAHEHELFTQKTKVNNLLTDLENAKTDLNYSNLEKQKLMKQNQILESEKQCMACEQQDHQLEFNNQVSKLQEQIGDLKDVIKLQDQQIEEMRKQNTIKDQEQQMMDAKAKEAEETMKSFYSLERFDLNFTSDVAIYLKKQNDDSFVKSLKQPKSYENVK